MLLDIATLGATRAPLLLILPLSISRTRDALWHVVQVVAGLPRCAAQGPLGRLVEKVQQNRGNGRDRGEQDEEANVVDMAPKPADLPGSEASGEDREVPGGDRARAQLRRREPSEDAKPVGQDVELARA